MRILQPGVGQVVGGDTLIIRLDEYERTQELRYLGCDGNHYVVTPSEAVNELLMVKLTVWNDKARSVLLTLDAEASELRGTAAQQRFAPVDIDAMKQESATPTEDQIDLERQYARPGARGGYSPLCQVDHDSGSPVSTGVSRLGARELAVGMDRI